MPKAHNRFRHLGFSRSHSVDDTMSKLFVVKSFLTLPLMVSDACIFGPLLGTAFEG